MKKVLRLLLLLLISVFMTQPVYAEFYSSMNGLDYSRDRWVEAGTTLSFKTVYVYKCDGGTKYTKLGLFSGSIDPSQDKNKVKCSDGQAASAVSQVSNGCHSNNACVKGTQYYCQVITNITCPPKKTVTPTPAPEPSTTATTTRTKATGGGTKTKKTTTTTTAQVTEPTTQIITEPITEAPKSNNTNIKSISVNKKSIGYKSTKDEYKFKVSYGNKAVSVDVETEDENATYKVEGNDNFDDANETETITITVTAADGEATKVVKLIAEKYKPSETDCTLANIFIKDYAINYEKNTFDYSLTLGKDVSNLDIETVKQYDGQIVQVNGNEKLKNKSKIVIEVESPSGDICTYNIKVKKNSSVGKYIVIILVLLIALGVAGYFLYRYINKSNGLYKYE